MPLNTDIRSVPTWLRWSGAFFTFVGALSLIVGGILPWARFSLLGTEIGIPGALQWGSVTIVIGLLVLYLTGLRRRLPLLVMLLGLVAVCIGVWAQEETGKQVRRQLLALENRLAPVNARLAEVTLPPIEPFGPGLGRSQDYRGPGPLWTILGGTGLALGGTLSFVGGRLGRSCRKCGVAWRTGRIVLFCPSCGTPTGRTDTCVQCRAPLERGDRHCASCGTPTSTVC
jgi:RNA polymerase subunit RPABC4/transcription elongation factor Spt4